ncbi:SDR family NAD(P)-dependent oxidoreductase [Luteolibacter sp. SL250]|uniref:SDR family oxidoreductase n=1 Tax=Luteolibacter sp. SL250 TaxID=2995170 RepID=UPI00226D5A7E|nr:SDR family NAD(P)-dependent oxidoreductase [Luteolibacter sp. SL250]WAC17908.1 SDR family NAD(P)-dependent oxidoreductase [Luteolibacter sp. SL250]
MKVAGDTLKGKTALVTGAGSGIGRATAKLLAHAGAKVALLARTEEDIRKVWNEIGGAGSGHLMFTADVADEGAMKGVFDGIAAEWDGLQIVVANAGINGTWAPLAEITLEEWNETLGINLTGTFLTVRGAYPMLKKRGGSVVIVSSVNGNRMFSNTGATAYSCSKAGQTAFAKMTALEFAKDHIRVNVICPGSIETDIDDSTDERGLESIRPAAEYPAGEVPLTGGGPGTAGQVAQLAWFLVSDASNHISGTEIYIDGTQSLLKG